MKNNKITKNKFKNFLEEMRKFRKTNEKYLLPDFYNLEKQKNYKIIILPNTYNL
jgi:hypothetical protein